MSTAAEILATIEQAMKAIEQMPRPECIYVPRWMMRQWLRTSGCPLRPHGRARSARGRKRALLASWRPLPGVRLSLVHNLPGSA